MCCNTVMVPETCTGLNLRPVPGPARELKPGPARGPRKLPISGPGPPAARAIEARPGPRIEARGPRKYINALFLHSNEIYTSTV